MTNTKLTKKDYFTALVEFFNENQIDFETRKGNISSEEFVDFAKHEIEILSKKNNRSTKPTAKQAENEKLKEVILEVLAENGNPMTITEIQKANSILGEYSNQRITAVTRIMREVDNTIIRTSDKRKSYFSLAE